LIEIPDFDFHMSIRVGDGAKIPDVTISADPDGWASRNGPGERFMAEPLVKLNGISTDIGVGRSGHLQIAPRIQNDLSFFTGYGELLH
jgi:hypothetical protein